MTEIYGSRNTSILVGSTVVKVGLPPMHIAPNRRNDKRGMTNWSKGEALGIRLRFCSMGVNLTTISKAKKFICYMQQPGYDDALSVVKNTTKFHFTKSAHET